MQDAGEPHPPVTEKLSSDSEAAGKMPQEHLHGRKELIGLDHLAVYIL